MSRFVCGSRVAVLALIVVAGAGCMGPERERGEGPTLTVSAGALSLAGVGDVVWDVEVVNGAAQPGVVWRQRFASSRFGDGAGSATYVGPCDASSGVSNHTVKLWVVGVYAGPVTATGEFAGGSGVGVVGTALPFENPSATGPLLKTAECRPNADTPVRFDVAIMRPAEQGFFDIAVNFNDIFCSAKFDCCTENTQGACVSDLALLHDGDGDRSSTFVLGFACTAGPRAGAETELYLDALELDCTSPADGFSADLVIDPAGPGGNQCVAAQTEACTPRVLSPSLDAGRYLYQIGLYRGLEDLMSGTAPAQKVYWNIALGVVRKGAGSIGIENCRLRTRGTADDALGTGLVDDGVIAAGAVYPFIEWDVDLGSCGAEPLTFGDPAAPVRTGYTRTDATAGLGFDYGFGPNRPAGPLGAVAGLCGAAHGTSQLVAPTVGLCASGVASAVAGAGPFTWSCAGVAGGATAVCAADRSCAGGDLGWTVGGSTCQGSAAETAHGFAVITTDMGDPTTGSQGFVCAQGSWSFDGAGTCVTPVDGECGAADGGSTLEAPTVGLCASGVALVVEGEGPYTWSCTGADGGATVECEADLSCAGVVSTWTAGGYGCEGTLPTTAHGGAANADDTLVPTLGSRGFVCVQGNWSATDGGSCLPSAPSGMSFIPPGTFTMGSPESERGRGVVSEAQHEVTLTRGFYLQTTEVTQGQWKALSGGVNPSCYQTPGSTSCSTANTNDSAPVERVDWYSALGYLNARSATEGLPACYTLSGCADSVNGWKDGLHSGCTGATFAGLTCTGYRLPTESEWEYAARAGTTTATYNGNLNEIDCSDTTLLPIAWFCGNAGGRTRPVAGMTANAWGLYDMLGNVWEWTWDWVGSYPGSVTDPLGPDTGFSRVYRGGGWGSVAGRARAAIRDFLGPAVRSVDTGFRPCRTVSP